MGMGDNGDVSGALSVMHERLASPELTYALT